MCTTPLFSVDTAVDFLFTTDSDFLLWKKPSAQLPCPQIFNNVIPLSSMVGALLFHKSTCIIVMTIP